MKNVEAIWAQENKDKINIIDVRTPAEFSQGHIEGAKNIPYPGIILNSDVLLDKNKEYYLICKSGNRSSTSVKQLEDKGFKVTNVVGGNEALGLA